MAFPPSRLAGRPTLVALALVGGFAALLAIALDGVLGRVAWVVTVVSGVLTLIVFVVQGRQAERRAVQRQKQMEAQISKVAWLVEPSRKIAGSVGQLRSDSEGFARTLRRVSSRLNDLEAASRPGALPRNVFGPSLVQETPVIPRVGGSLPGRIAADVAIQDDPAGQFRRIFDAAENGGPQRWAVMGSSRSMDAVRSIGRDPQLLLPMLGWEQARTDTSCLYIDEEALDDGPWVGVRDAQGTSRLATLLSFVEAASRAHVVILLAPATIPTHASGLLRGLAHAVVGEEFDARWGGDLIAANPAATGSGS